MNDPELIQIIRNMTQPLEPLPTDTGARIESLPGVKAVVFDIYGTLVVSGSGDIGLAAAEDREGLMREALDKNGVPYEAEGQSRFVDVFHNCITEAQQRRRQEGVKYPEVEIREVWRATLRELAAQGRLKTDPTAYDERRIAQIALTYECLSNPVWPMPGLGNTLERLKGAGKVLGIVSNAQFFTPLLFRAFLEKGLDDLDFNTDARIYSYALREAKPSVRLYELLTNRLGQLKINPHEVLYVGNDMRNDIWPAHAVGLKTALFAGDKRSLRLRKDDPDVAGVVPDLVVTELSQVAEAVGA